ncbi:hypothetical protein GCM10022631_41720 [Deinococcus rubellus]|uniref:TubC N-terminal docking domain-containing protein n=1 Tax=Deinococcus rubellus TaxID=1889240 RepID=A0ABY5YIY9_9DEIO|nr:hypothetical protein [Deinococcus rubellus]UWX65044.1 hypothetical protein N0D28_05145 [Deinococcus rubellus]
MTLPELRHALSQYGVSLTLTSEGRLKVNAQQQPPADLMAALRLHRDALICDLQPPALPGAEPLPGHLAALVDVARAGQSPRGAVKLASGLVTDLAGYVLAWAECWPRDRAHILQRLEEARAAVNL